MLHGRKQEPFVLLQIERCNTGPSLDTRTAFSIAQASASYVSAATLFTQRNMMIIMYLYK